MFRDGEIAEWVRTHTSLAEDLGSVPNTSRRQLKLLTTPVLGDTIVSGLYGHLHAYSTQKLTRKYYMNKK